MSRPPDDHKEERTMGTARGSTTDRIPGAARVERPRRRLGTETKAAFKTTELAAYVLAVAAVLIAAMIVDESDSGGFGAQQAWLYVTLLTVGYMLSRGFAKSGSRDPYWDENDRDDR
jgi:hypothetical protein